MEPRGCNRRQSAANQIGADRAKSKQPLPWVATGCLRRSMVSTASAVGCHRFRKSPPCEGGGRPVSGVSVRALLLVAVRARTLLASTAGARLTDHAAIVSAKQSAA